MPKGNAVLESRLPKLRPLFVTRTSTSSAYHLCLESKNKMEKNDETKRLSKWSDSFTGLRKIISSDRYKERGDNIPYIINEKYPKPEQN